MIDTIFKMFDKILIVYNEKLTEKHLRTVERVKDLLKGREVSIAKSHNLSEPLFNDVDLVITIGGDGTFIRASHFIRDTLILGINSEPEYSEGALTSIMESEVDFLREVLNGKFKTIRRQRAKLTKNGLILKKPALNEIYVGTDSQFHTSRYKIIFKGQEEEHRSSGALVVTGSGSNAWYKSAGGIPFDYGEKKLKFIIREPYFGNRIFKPKILYGEIKEGEKITFKAERREKGIIAIDSNLTYDFNIPDIVEIELAEMPLNVIVKGA